jgi:hypothetical protein
VLTASRRHFALNMTGPETLVVRDIAVEFGRHFGVERQFNSGTGILSIAE